VPNNNGLILAVFIFLRFVSEHAYFCRIRFHYLFQFFTHLVPFTHRHQHISYSHIIMNYNIYYFYIVNYNKGDCNIWRDQRFRLCSACHFVHTSNFNLNYYYYHCYHYYYSYYPDTNNYSPSARFYLILIYFNNALSVL